METTQHPVGQSPLPTRGSQALPYYFYILGVLAALGSAALLVLMEVKGSYSLTTSFVHEAFASAR